MVFDCIKMLRESIPRSHHQTLRDGECRATCTATISWCKWAEANMRGFLLLAAVALAVSSTGADAALRKPNPGKGARPPLASLVTVCRWARRVCSKQRATVSRSCSEAPTSVMCRRRVQLRQNATDI